MNLTDIQREIVEAPLGPAIVTAGAGSGKTRVLTHRIAYLVNKMNISSNRILALTFTNKAAGEMKRRVEDMMFEPPCNSFLGTFHAWCTRFLRRNIKVPYTCDFTIYDRDDSIKVYKTIWKKLGIYEKHDDYDIKYSQEVKDMYRHQLEQSNALDFDMLIEMTYNILSSDKEICDREGLYYEYILVDEFQDTDTIQYKIVSLLAREHQNLMVVGDEDQCIYSWRGASIENLNAFRRDFPLAKIYKLEENFRSSKNIVSLANVLVAENCNRLDKVLFSNLPEGKIELKQHYDERAEARDIAMQIATAHHRDGAKYGDFAVLMRLNATSRSFEEQFRTFNIPHIIWGGFKFYERAEVKSVINYLRVLVNPYDSVALVDILNYPKRGIGDATVEKLRERFPAVEVIDGISAKAKEGIKNFLHTFNTLRDIHDNFGLHDLAASLISTIGLDQLYKAGKEEDLNRLENLYQLESAIKSFAAENPTATLSQYLQSVSLVQDTDSGAQEDSVIISTVHSAKGLEFKNVFIIGLEDGLFPLNRAKQSASELEEERRLMYVAVTRARRNLFLSYCMSRYYQGDRKWTRPSQFLEECGLEIPQSSPFDFENRQSSQGYNNRYNNGGSIYSRQNRGFKQNRSSEDDWFTD